MSVKESQVEPSNNASAVKLTKILVVIALAYFTWALVADRHTPITDQARVRGFVVPIVPQVSGVITKMHVAGDQVVKQGDILFEIDSSDYQLALEQANSQLELAGQELGANTAAVGAAKARLEKAKADLVTKEANANRIFALKDEGIVTLSEVDRNKGMVEKAKQEVLSAEQSYIQAQQVMGEAGSKNAKIQSALTKVAEATLNIERTVVRAPGNGFVSYVKIDEGYYANKGATILTFISNEYAWIEAAYKENNLGNIAKGNPVQILLDARPGVRFNGEIVSVGYGVSFDKNTPGALPIPQKPKGWMRDPQRFTVIIKFTDLADAQHYLREGGQADVITYTGDSFILNSLGKLWSWLTSYLSYVY
ncbi:HlyD family secretion protein [Thalassotalea sp. LPB0316]|uniref:HlyD family secretion protein n=1 Tax=Thalassotalea sp. LPB0316 TaxID=2769490 RepID=UPI0018671C73|nr:HlyD family secretion protein [Thalassotalea sp. LPB0316]QOL26360.1 HlyD family secretion protein [Thalassotalea sp. LPB0316]